MRKTERNFTNKVLESKRGDVQAVKSKIKSSVMAVAFLFAATMPLTMAVSSRKCAGCCHSAKADSDCKSESKNKYVKSNQNDRLLKK